MKISRRTLPLGAKTSLALLALASLSILPAQAQVNLSFSAASTSNIDSIGGDADFHLAAGSGTVQLTYGDQKTVNIQSLFFDVNGTTTEGDSGLVAFSRLFSVNGQSATATQNYDLSTSYPDGTTTFGASDDLLLYPGTTIQYDLGAQGVLDFTPYTLESSFIGVDSGPGLSQATYTENVQGRFLLQPAAAPEPSQFAVLGLGLLSLGCLALRTRSKHVHENT